MQNNSNITFVQVEIAFFKMWWDLQNGTTKKEYINLLKNKQIEFLNGGVSMNDEACSYYEDIIENHSYGH